VQGRTVVLGVCGGIAAYKAVEVCRRLTDAGASVLPVLTRGATRFVTPLTFSALAAEPARTRLFDDPDDPIPHTRLGRRADLVLVAPATAGFCARYAAGLADDLLTATLLATRAPVVLAPAMHTEMWEHPAVRANLATLTARGVTVVEPEVGRLAGGDEGAGRLADPARIVEVVAAALAARRDLEGVRVLVTAGGTREPIDAVRYLGNRSSGKMGHALARVAHDRGAAVTLVTTRVDAGPFPFPTVVVGTAEEMRAAVRSRFADSDVVVMAAAVADFRPKAPAEGKWKKDDGVPELVLEPTPDILAELGAAKAHQLLVGFAAETGDVVVRAAAKLARKRLDLVVANDVSAPDAGFEVDTNRAVLLDSGGPVSETPLVTKAELAGIILDQVAARLGRAGRDGTPREQM
jgi:phosphopantothenoylcysteine decarboxylase/phosphopantothenate--cysteine ligase